jgi:phosphate transport system substrate-binding protein
MHLNRKRLASLTVLVVVAGAATGLTTTAGATTATTSAGGSLVGAGSTLMAPLMAQWTQDFNRKFHASVTYGAVGSGAGIAQITARTVDFGASDAPLTPAQAAACNQCFQIPWALTGVAVSFHINGVSNLKLTGPVIAAIYLGQITTWNDPRIKKLNPGVALPALKITPAFRSDGSGDTYAFTDYLSRISKTWKSRVGNATQVSFPTGVGGKGNDGVTAILTSTNGAIGYISASYAIAHRLGAAAVQNAAGKFLFPNLKNIEAAAQTVKKVPRSNEMHIVNPSKKAKNAYPLSTFSYAIVPKVTGKKFLLAQFILYAMRQGQRFGAALDFAPIPKVVNKAGIATVRRFQAG